MQVLGISDCGWLAICGTSLSSFQPQVSGNIEERWEEWKGRRNEGAAVECLLGRIWLLHLRIHSSFHYLHNYMTVKYSTRVGEGLPWALPWLFAVCGRNIYFCILVVVATGTFPIPQRLAPPMHIWTALIGLSGIYTLEWKVMRFSMKRKGWKERGRYLRELCRSWSGIIESVYDQDTVYVQNF